MALYELHMPQMGESILEATILKWMIEEGQEVQQDEIILEVATDKVDSEIPSPVAGKVVKIKAKEGDEVPVGQIIAIMETQREFTRTEQDLKLQESKSPSPSIVTGNDEPDRSEEHTSELQSRGHLVCRLLLEKKKRKP